MSILQLPSEVVVEIFSYLTPSETVRLLQTLSPYRCHASIATIMRLMYQRLYQGRVIIANKDSQDGFDCDTPLTINAFENRFSQHSYENTVFKSTRPNCIEFRFTRSANDYSDFIADLYKVNELFNGGYQKEDSGTNLYLEKALQMELYIDANLMMIENPTSVSTILIKLLVNLASPQIAPKLTKLCVKSTDMGNIYVSQWSKLFQNFTTLKLLDLSDNIIRTKYEDCDDIVANFCLPTSLETLILDNNSLTVVSDLRSLPASLKELSLNNNNITAFNAHDITKHLPSLTTLMLNYNRLAYMDPKPFEGSGITLEVRGTNLNRAELKASAEANNYTVVI